MKISAVTVLEYSRQLDGRSWNPSFRWTERRAPLVLIEADNGVTGVGEAWCRQPAIGEILAHLAEAVAPRLLGADVSGPEAIALAGRQLRSLRPVAAEAWVAAAAASAIDIALWDLLARSRHEPLWRTLGGVSDRVPVYASGGLYRDGDGLDALAAEMRRYVEAGFRAVKMKVGALPLGEDLARVQATRGAVGAQAELWVDAVNQLNRENALVWARALADAGITAIQAPVPFSDVATMGRINGECLPVIAGEAEHETAGFERLLAAGAVTLLQPNLGLCGGLAAAARIAAKAREHLVDTTPQTFGTAVLQAASLHWGAANPGVRSVEFHRFHDHLAELLCPAFRTLSEGRVVLGGEPGLGIDLPVPGPQADGGTIRCHSPLATHQ